MRSTGNTEGANNFEKSDEDIEITELLLVLSRIRPVCLCVCVMQYSKKKLF